MWKHYLAGVMPGLVLNIFWAIYTSSTEYLLISAIILLPGGLLAGFIGHMVEGKASKNPPQTFRDVVMSLMLGIIFLFPSICSYMFISNGCIFC